MAPVVAYSRARLSRPAGDRRSRRAAARRRTRTGSRRGTSPPCSRSSVMPSFHRRRHASRSGGPSRMSRRTSLTFAGAFVSAARSRSMSRSSVADSTGMRPRHLRHDDLLLVLRGFALPLHLEPPWGRARRRLRHGGGLARGATAGQPCESDGQRRAGQDQHAHRARTYARRTRSSGRAVAARQAASAKNRLPARGRGCDEGSRGRARTGGCA